MIFMGWTGRTMIGLYLLVLGCGGGGPMDGGPEEDAPLSEVGDVGQATDVGPPGCAVSALSSPDSIGYVFSGVGMARDYLGRDIAAPLEEGVTVLFPEGTADGSRAITVHPVNWPFVGVAVSEAVVVMGHAAIRASGISGNQEFTISGDLDLTTGWIRATATRNFARPDTDVAEPGMGTVDLCWRAEVTGMPEMTLLAHEITPLGVIRLGGSAPLSEDLAVTVSIDGTPLAVDVTAQEGVVAIRPRGAFPPGATLTVQATGTDLLGRPSSLTEMVQVTGTSAIITDLALDTEPPAGAIVGSWDTDGLHVATQGLALASPAPPTLVAALGEAPAGASMLRVSNEGLFFDSSHGRVGLITDAGEVSPIDLTMVGGDALVALPAPGALYLVVDLDERVRRPQWLPPPGGSWSITALAFE